MLTMINRRFAIVALSVLALIWGLRLLPIRDYSSSAWQTAKQSLSDSSKLGNALDRSWALPPGRRPADVYYDQVFAGGASDPYDFATLQESCAAADWDADEAYLNCVAILAGMTSIMSQVRVCLKMAVESGSHLVLPRIPLRDSHNLLNFNLMNPDAYMPYDKWFDADHLRLQLARACPRMRIVHPDDLDHTVPVARYVQVLCSDAVGYSKLHSYFWVGRPFRPFFAKVFARRVAEHDAKLIEAGQPVPTNSSGITVVDIDSEFMVYRLTDDPTGREMRFWNDLGHLVRFRPDVRDLVSTLAPRLPAAGRYYGVHYRAENDSIWSTAEHQLGVDLDALDQAWEQFGAADGFGTEKPPVYLACGDAEQVEQFVAAAAERGWDVTHKWRLATENGDHETAARINALAFDFQGAVDMGLMVRAEFFIGIQGSAFSSTIANQRDRTGRYRGSSFDIPDAGARTHLFNDLDANEYACCL